MATVLLWRMAHGVISGVNKCHSRVPLWYTVFYDPGPCVLGQISMQFHNVHHDFQQIISRCARVTHTPRRTPISDATISNPEGWEGGGYLVDMQYLAISSEDFSITYLNYLQLRAQREPFPDVLLFGHLAMLPELLKGIIQHSRCVCVCITGKASREMQGYWGRDQSL